MSLLEETIRRVLCLEVTMALKVSPYIELPRSKNLHKNVVSYSFIFLKKLHSFKCGVIIADFKKVEKLIFIPRLLTATTTMFSDDSLIAQADSYNENQKYDMGSFIKQ